MQIWKYTFLLLLLILAVVIIAIFQLPDQNLHIVACDVGQGDAILVIKGTTEILTDGGPDKSVLGCLGRYLPFWDRDIELVISSHPDADHLTGLTDVIKNYHVEKILINPADPGTDVYGVLKKEVGGWGIPVINPAEGMKLRLGLIYLDIENPTVELLDRLTVKTEGDKLAKYSISGETNLYSIVYKLSFGGFTGLFTGDAPPEVSDALAGDSSIGPVDYIKVPHHGSKNGLTENLLKVVVPKVAVISVGKNPWGFPHKEVLDLLEKYNVKVLRTDEKEDVIISTDGNKWWIN
jgi:competence protein ComEC